MKEPRDTAYGLGLDVVVTLPFNVLKQIKEAAKERGEDAEGWCRAELIALIEGEGATEVAPGELMLDVHAALEKDPVTQDMDPFASRGFAHRIGTH